MYKAYAKWWADSITAWAGYGINADYISMQNEPDYAAVWESCRFNPTETPDYASYNQAFEAVYAELYSRFGSGMPKMLAPEATGFNGSSGGSLASYCAALTNPSHVYGYSHHLYNPGNGDSPDGYLSAMSSFAASYGSKPLFQTEYSHNNTTFDDAMNLAILMHNSLTVESVASYFYWQLFWESPGGLVSFPSYGSPSYTINSVYYAFKHYSKFTDPGWHRVAADAYSSGLRISAYKSPDDSNMAIVIINTSDAVDSNLALSLGSLPPTSSEIYRSVSGSYWSYVGDLNLSGPLLVPKKSITTIHLTPTCVAAIAGGYRLYSDINTDCYVDIEDLGEFALRWLRNDCDESNNYCNFADIDFSSDVDFIDLSWFGSQWLTCNDPQNPECSPNW